MRRRRERSLRPLPPLYLVAFVVAAALVATFFGSSPAFLTGHGATLGHLTAAPAAAAVGRRGRRYVTRATREDLVADLNAKATWGDIEAADQLLREVLEISPNMDVEDRRTMFNMAISACSKSGKPGDGARAGSYLEEMQGQGIQPNFETYNNLMATEAALGNLQAVEKYDSDMQQYLSDDSVGEDETFRRRVAILDMKMQASGRAGNVESLHKYFAECDNLMRLGPQAQNATREQELFTKLFGTAIVAAAGCGQLNLAEKWLELATTRGFSPDVGTYNGIMRTLHRRSPTPLDHCEDWFDRMKQSGVTPDPSTFRALIRAARHQKLPLRAEYWFVEARRAGFKPCAITWSTLLSAVSGDPQITKQWYTRMSQDTQPESYAYLAMIQSMGRSKLMEEAEGYMEDLLEQGVEPNLQIFHALMEAAAISGDVDRAVFWFEEMEERGQKPIAKSWSLLIKACVNAWKGTDKRRFQKRGVDYFKLMIEQGVAPTRGLLTELAILISWRRVEYWAGMWGIEIGPIMEDASRGKRHRQQQLQQQPKQQLEPTLAGAAA